jgi:hypothetical protein
MAVRLVLSYCFRRCPDFATAERRIAPVLKISPLALPFLALLSLPALAEPPADIDACIKLSAETARTANVRTEAEYFKFHMVLMNLDAACGAGDFAGAEKIANDIRAAFPPKK